MIQSWILARLSACKDVTQTGEMKAFVFPQLNEQRHKAPICRTYWMVNLLF